MSEDSVAARQLRAFVERAERLNGEKTAINQDLSELFKEMKGEGFDTKVVKAIISDRAKDPDKKSEFDALYEIYAEALGMVPANAGADVQVHEEDWQSPRVASLGDQKDAYRAGRPISQDFRFENASVYFFAFHEIGRIKIGVSNDIPGRLRDLEMEQGCQGVILLAKPGNRKAEMAEHQLFEPWRVEGEWFRDCPEVRALIATRAPAQGHDEDGVFPDDEPQSSQAAVQTAKPVVLADQHVAENEARPISLVESETVEISTPITPSQPAPAARDLTTDLIPQGDGGQVATHTLETANELPPAPRGNAGEDDLREPAATERGQIAQEGDAPLEAAANAYGEVLSGQSAHLSIGFPVVAGADLPVVETEANASKGVTGGESAATNITPIRPAKPLRPNCLNPDMCGGQGRQHCWSCTKAAQESGAA